MERSRDHVGDRHLNASALKFLDHPGKRSRACDVELADAGQIKTDSSHIAVGSKFGSQHALYLRNRREPNNAMGGDRQGGPFHIGPCGDLHLAGEVHNNCQSHADDNTPFDLGR